jgi:hypothetical protein
MTYPMAMPKETQSPPCKDDNFCAERCGAGRGSRYRSDLQIAACALRLVATSACRRRVRWQQSQGRSRGERGSANHQQFNTERGLVGCNYQPGTWLFAVEDDLPWIATFEGLTK